MAVVRGDIFNIIDDNFFGVFTMVRLALRSTSGIDEGSENV